MPTRKPPLSIALILAWADEHQTRTGKYPRIRSGPVAVAPGETWGAIDRALGAGTRGLPGKDSIARLLQRERGPAAAGEQGGPDAVGVSTKNS